LSRSRGQTPVSTTPPSRIYTAIERTYRHRENIPPSKEYTAIERIYRHRKNIPPSRELDVGPDTLDRFSETLPCGLLVIRRAREISYLVGFGETGLRKWPSLADVVVGDLKIRQAIVTGACVGSFLLLMLRGVLLAVSGGLKNRAA
jgi:hypothetical protein